MVMEMSAVSHCATCCHALSVSRVKIEGVIAYAVSGTPADCASLGISKALFLEIPDLVISGINKGSNCRYHMVSGKSSIHDFKLGAEACLPIINAILTECKNRTYPQRCFLNMALPANVADHKGKSLVKMGWKQVISDMQGGKMLSTMTKEIDSLARAETDTSSPTLEEHLLFNREVIGPQFEEDDADFRSLQEGYITVTPLGALSHPEIDCQAYFKDWVPRVVECPSSSA